MGVNQFIRILSIHLNLNLLSCHNVIRVLVIGKGKVSSSLCPGGGGGGGYSPQILVGMCRGKVKNGPGLRNELPVERKNAGLRI